MSSRYKRLPKPKRNICRQCAAGNHTGHTHSVCPECERRIEPGGQHLHLVDGKRLVFRA